MLTIALREFGLLSAALAIASSIQLPSFASVADSAWIGLTPRRLGKGCGCSVWAAAVGAARLEPRDCPNETWLKNAKKRRNEAAILRPALALASSRRNPTWMRPVSRSRPIR